MILGSLDADLKNIVAGLAKKANLSLSKEIEGLVFFDISTEKDHGDYATSCASRLSNIIPSLYLHMNHLGYLF